MYNMNYTYTRGTHVYKNSKSVINIKCRHTNANVNTLI